MSKILIGLLAVVMLLGGFRLGIVEGATDLRTDPTIEAFVRATAVGVTAANVTLVSELFQDDIVNVTSIASTVGTDTPTATLYTTASNTLLISALTANTSRTLTVNFVTETDDPVWLALGPFLLLLIIGGLLAAIFYGMFKKSKRR